MMKIRASRTFCLLALTIAVGALSRPSVANEETEALLRVKEGDDSRWALPEWDDRDWKTESLECSNYPTGNSVGVYSRSHFIPARSGIRWIRIRVRVGESTLEAPSADGDPRNFGAFQWPADKPDLPSNGLFLATVYCYELYWDGQLFIQNGVVGKDRESEIPGRLDRHILVPERLRTPGVHVLAFRISSWHYNFPADSFGFGFVAGNYTKRLVHELRRPLFPIVASTSALFMAAICGVLFSWVERRRPFLLCGLLSLAVAIFYALVALRWLYQEPFHWFCPRLVTITAMMTLISVLMPWLLLEQFAVPRKRWWLAPLLPMLAAAWWVSPLYETIALWLCYAMLMVSLAITARAAWNRRPGSRAMLVGLFLCLLTVQTSRRDFINPAFFFTFNGLVLLIVAQLGIQIRASRRQAQQAKLTAARLEIELLRKNLQPHFLMNTLTALMEVIEQNPKTAVRLIDDLSREFRLLTAMSAEKSVPLEQELDLCRAHLRVVSIRSAADYRLDVEGFDGAAEVPPALFLTLIENGFSHQRFTGRSAIFTLSCDRIADRRCFRFFSPGEVEIFPAHSRGGTGLRYVRARLEESFPGRWSLTHGAVENGWRTVIETRAAAHFAS